MKIARIPLLEALNTVKPALASKDLIEELTHVWFDGKFAMAYNDAELGIQVPCPTPFKGGIRGALLTGLLQNSRAKEVTFEEAGDGAMLLKAAQARATLSVLEPARMAAVWKFPPVNMKNSFALTEDFALALRSVLISVGNKVEIPDTLGVTFIGDDGLSLYATDSDTIATMQIDAPKGFKRGDRILVPTAFCEQLLKLIGRAGGFMEVCKDCVVAGNDDGALIYARLIDAPKPSPLDKLVAKHDKFPKGAKFQIPERLSLALDRMAVLFEGMTGETMLVKIGGGEMRMLAKVKGRGELDDSVDIPDDVPAITFRTEPSRIKRALATATYMVCSEDAVRMSDPRGFVYLASNSMMAE